LGLTADGALLPLEALTAIHWSHRLGAVAVSLLAGSFAIALLRTGERVWQTWGGVLLALLLAQVGLGIANVLLALPLGLAIAHNIGAACLLSATLSINILMYHCNQRGNCNYADNAATRKGMSRSDRNQALGNSYR
jgi:cytochrome c oxidase assembly protein subunit 15